MLQNAKPEKITTNLSAIALCITVGLSFLIAAALVRSKFASPAEWWIFTGIGMVWVSVAFFRFFELHKQGFVLAQQHKTIDQYRVLMEKEQMSLASAQELIKLQVEIMKVQGAYRLTEAPIAVHNSVENDPEHQAQEKHDHR